MTSEKTNLVWYPHAKQNECEDRLPPSSSNMWTIAQLEGVVCTRLERNEKGKLVFNCSSAPSPGRQMCFACFKGWKNQQKKEKKDAKNQEKNVEKKESQSSTPASQSTSKIVAEVQPVVLQSTIAQTSAVLETSTNSQSVSAHQQLAASTNQQPVAQQPVAETNQQPLQLAASTHPQLSRQSFQHHQQQPWPAMLSMPPLFIPQHSVVGYAKLRPDYGNQFFGEREDVLRIVNGDMSAAIDWLCQTCRMQGDVIKSQIAQHDPLMRENMQLRNQNTVLIQQISVAEQARFVAEQRVFELEDRLKKVENVLKPSTSSSFGQSSSQEFYFPTGGSWN